MEISKQEYQKFVKDREKASPMVKDCLLAFAIGGSICVLGPVILDGWLAAGLTRTDAGTATPITLVLLAVVIAAASKLSKRQAAA